MFSFQRRLTPYLFLLPALIILGLTVFYPAWQAFALSFTQYDLDLTQAPQWVGLKNFQRLWQDRIFWQSLGNSALYLLGVVPLLVIAPLVLAVLVNQKLRGVAGFRAAFYTPVIISMVVAGIAWRALYASDGVLNQALRWLGLTEGIPWLTSPQWALGSVMAVTVWKGLGYYMVIYLAGLQGIPADLYEAAALDGAGGWERHWYITLPLMRPYLLLVGVISSISALKVFEEVYIMTQGGPLNHTKTVVYYLYELAFQNLDLNYAAAVGLVLFGVIFLFSLANLKLSRHGQLP
ncbi:MAG: ABC transporter permease subunit [Cyanobacteria bacterium RI_101]|nr:ABC transporter permease subunit [Cyanobacteria bacterium RI_101]